MTKGVSSVRDWLAFAVRARFHPAILAYIRVFPGDIHLDGALPSAGAPTMRVFDPVPTGRAWEQLNARLTDAPWARAEPPLGDDGANESPPLYDLATRLLGREVGSGVMAFVNGLERRPAEPEPEPEAWWDRRPRTLFETTVADNGWSAIVERHDGFHYRPSKMKRRVIGPFPSFSAAQQAISNARAGLTDPIED
jgi:hypothetical protein